MMFPDPIRVTPAPTLGDPQVLSTVYVARAGTPPPVAVLADPVRADLAALRADLAQFHREFQWWARPWWRKVWDWLCEKAGP